MFAENAFFAAREVGYGFITFKISYEAVHFRWGAMSSHWRRYTTPFAPSIRRREISGREKEEGKDGGTPFHRSYRMFIIYLCSLHLHAFSFSCHWDSIISCDKIKQSALDTFIFGWVHRFTSKFSHQVCFPSLAVMDKSSAAVMKKYISNKYWHLCY